MTKLTYLAKKMFDNEFATLIEEGYVGFAKEQDGMILTEKTKNFLLVHLFSQPEVKSALVAQALADKEARESEE